MEKQRIKYILENNAMKWCERNNPENHFQSMSIWYTEEVPRLPVGKAIQYHSGNQR